MKNQYFLSFLLFFGIVVSGNSQHAFLEQGVLNKLAESDSNTLIPVFLKLEDAVDIALLKSEFISRDIPVEARPGQVMTRLKSKAAETQPEVISFIENSGLAYSNLQQFWIANAISLDASPDLIRALAEQDFLERIALNLPAFGLIAPKKGTGNPAKSVGGTEPGLVAIGAPEMWAMGYTGQSLLVLTFDTGAWPDHPAFENRYLVNRMPLSKTWFGYDSDVPVDKSDSHGTHVSGTILGLDTATADTIGSAMNAYLIVTDPIVQNLDNVKPLSELMLGYEWALNPDGDENTSDDVPDVINNSWGRDNTVVDQDWAPCSEVVVPVLEAVEAAGIANVFSAGNEGPSAETIGVPHNISTGLVNSFTVGAVNGNVASNWPIAEFSSRGPGLCGGEGSILIKPEVSAPGVNVRSSVQNGEYDLFSGTSMASPHVSGAVLLLKEAFPFLSGEDLLLALYYSATDLGPTGEDNTFGMGMINVKDAYDYLAETYEPIPPASHDTDLELLSIASPSEVVACAGQFEQSSVSPEVVVRNNGVSDITGITIHYTVNGENETIFSDDELILAAGSDTEIELPFSTIGSSGSKELHVWIETLEGEYDVFNNHNVFRWKLLPEEDINLFATETFESGIDPERWTIKNPDGNITWDTLRVIQADGTEGLAAWMNFKNYDPNSSQKDYLITPTLFSGEMDVEFPGINLSFDLFYRHKSNNQFLQDTLVINFKENCDYTLATATEIFRRGGDSLYSVPDGDSYAYPEDSTEWSHIEMTVPFENANVTDPFFYLEFQGINRRGNHLLIDNINISLQNGVGIDEVKSPGVTLYPNPTNTSFSIKTDKSQRLALLEIYDVFGRKISALENPSSNKSFDVSQLARGVYLVSLEWENAPVSTARLIIQ